MQALRVHTYPMTTTTCYIPRDEANAIYAATLVDMARSAAVLGAMTTAERQRFNADVTADQDRFGPQD